MRADITLSHADVRLARVVAYARQGAALARGLVDRFGALPLAAALGLHEGGARSEIAFARMIGVDVRDDWVDYVNCDLASAYADVAGWQVRATRYRTGCLIIRPGDKTGPPYALLTTGDAITYHAAGWLPGGRARRPEFWRNLDGFGPYAWCVPQTALSRFG